MKRDNRFFVLKIAAVVLAVVAALIFAAILFRRNSSGSDNYDHLSAKITDSPIPDDSSLKESVDVEDPLNDYDRTVNIEISDSYDDEDDVDGGDIDNGEFFLMDAGGELVVYYSDKKTVFMHTGIPSASVSADERERLRTGYYIDNEEELYALLESYSS